MLVAGSVSVADDGTESFVPSSSLAASLYTKYKTRYQAQLMAAGQVPPTGAASVPVHRNLALQAQDLAEVMVTYLVANTEVVISTSTGALQRASGVDTTAPSAERTLPIR